MASYFMAHVDIPEVSHRETSELKDNIRRIYGFQQRLDTDACMSNYVVA